MAQGACIGSSETNHIGCAEAGLTLLLVEDEPLCREMALLRLKGRFQRVLVAADGVIGMQLFREHAPDIVLSDHFMPGLSGVEMAQQIRALNQEASIILMTSAMDNETLLEAINIGVNRFVPKPLDFQLLVRILDDLVREFINRRELGQRRLQELELLRYRDSYNSMQQETARRKERHVVRHDLHDQAVAGAGGIRWGIKVTHSPRDIMCGDGYTIRNLFDGRQLIFLVDAMGSGLSASLSALLATSFCNYQVDHLHQWQNFNLQLFLKRFQEYLGGILLEEEALSCGFLLVDLAAQELEMAMFGLPPMLVRSLEGSVRRIAGRNPPLCIFSHDIQFATLSLAEAADLLIMTDGVTDASLHAGGTYRERLEDDFRAAPTLASLQRRFRFHTDSEDLDDLTFLHLQRLDLPAAWSWRVSPSEHAEPLEAAIDRFLQALNTQIALDGPERCALTSLLRATLSDPEASDGPSGPEHKLRLSHSDARETPPYQQASLWPGRAWKATLWRGATCPLLVVEIDHGDHGLWDQLPHAQKRSYLKRVANLCDSVFVGAPGGSLLFLRTIEGGEDRAN